MVGTRLLAGFGFACGWFGFCLCFIPHHYQAFSFLSMMTWALRPHGVRTRGKKWKTQALRSVRHSGGQLGALQFSTGSVMIFDTSSVLPGSETGLESNSHLHPVLLDND